MKKLLSRGFAATLNCGKSLFTLCLICSVWMFISCSNDDLSAGVPVCINTDNMTVSNTTVASEIQKLHDAGILTAEQAKAMVRTGINHTFLSDQEKEELLQLAERRMN